jgi:hypothetical protein
MGGAGTAGNIASQTIREERGYRSIVLPFGLFQVLPHWDVFNPTGDEFNPVCAVEYAASPIHYTIGRKPCDLSQPGAAFVNDIVNARFSRDLNAYRGFQPDTDIMAEGLANPSWGKTFALRRDANGGLVHGLYAGAGPYFSVQTEAQIDPALVDVLASPTPTFRPNTTFQLGALTAEQMALAITGGYRGRISLPNRAAETDGVYVAANYHYLRGFRYDRFDIATRLDTDVAGMLTARPGTTGVSIGRLASSSGNGFAIDLGTAVALDQWTFGFGASGLANRLEWDEMERARYSLQSLFGGAEFDEVELPAPAVTERVELPVSYTANVGYESGVWSAESEFAHGYNGKNFYSGLEYRFVNVELRGGARYSRDRWYPTGGAGFNFSPRVGIDVAAFGTGANIERRRDVAIAVSLRIMSQP